ncbi:MAG: lysylphosphatidylglycerol synthase transmembrane domain-containing protein [bacterium]|jgi:uncharacterized membrane protein YbhN (UPF0104 family)
MKGLSKKHALWSLAVLLMAAFLYWGREDLGRIRDLDPFYALLCFGCTLAMSVVSALKWKMSIRSTGETGRVSFGTLLYYFMFGRTVGLVLPMDISDFGVRTMSLRFGHDFSIGRASYSVYLDRTFDVVVAGLFIVPSVLYVAGAIRPLTGIALFGAALLLGLVCFGLFGRLTMRALAYVFRILFGVVCRIPWIGRRVEFEAERKLLEEVDLGGIAFWLYLLSLLKFFFTSMRFVAMAAAVGLGLGGLRVLLFVPAAQFAAVIALTPGGLGIADWSWSGLLYKIGADKHLIVPYLLSLRIVVSLSIIVIAGLSWLIFRKASRGKDEPSA